MSKIELKYLLIVLVAAWAVCCVWSRGPAILGYLAMQAATSGVFAWAILKSLKKSQQAQTQHGGDVLKVNAETVEAVKPQLQGTQAG